MGFWESVLPQCVKDFIIKHDIQPAWAWKIPQPKKHEQAHQYNQILANCRTAQYYLALVLLFVAVFCEKTRVAVDELFANGDVLTVIDICVLVLLGYYLGAKRVPANYIPFVIMRMFTTVDSKLTPQVLNFQLKVLRPSYEYGYVSVLTYSSKPTVESQAASPQVRNLVMLPLLFGGIWTLTKTTKINVSSKEVTALVCTTVATSSAAFLLITSHALYEFPEWADVHRSFCEIWVLLACCHFIFMLTFLVQRVQRIANHTVKTSHSLRMFGEMVIFFSALFIMLRYIPVIHQGFSNRQLLSNAPSRLIEFFSPNVVSNFVKVLWAYSTGIADAIFNIWGRILKA